MELLQIFGKCLHKIGQESLKLILHLLRLDYVRQQVIQVNFFFSCIYTFKFFYYEPCMCFHMVWSFDYCFVWLSGISQSIQMEADGEEIGIATDEKKASDVYVLNGW